MKAGKSVACPKKGRRLKEASAAIDDFAAKHLELASNLQLQDVEGDEGLFLDACYMLRCFPSYTKLKFAHFKLIPYLLVNADTPAVAAECLAQFDGGQQELHHSILAFREVHVAEG